MSVVFGLADGTRLRVRGGRPTPEEIAAVVLALDTLHRERAEAEAGRTARPPGWLRAALLEGLGGRPVASPAELDRPF